jgi:cyclase
VTNPDFSKVEVKTFDIGNNTYLLQGAGGNVTVAVGTDGIIMVDSQFAPMHDRLKAAIEKISPLPIKYVINTHYHTDHTEGNAAFHRDGATIVAHVNVRARLAQGNTPNGLTGNRMVPQPADALPTNTYSVASTTLQVGGRKAQLNHIYNAHTDGDTWVYFEDANVLVTGDTFRKGLYTTIDFTNGGDITGLIRAVDAYLEASNNMTKIVSGHGRLATKADLVAWREMLVTSRDRIRILIAEGKSEQDVLTVKPLADLDAVWAMNEQQAQNWIRMVYRSLTRC